MDHIIEIKNLSMVYSGNNIALNHINLSINQGRIIGLLGPNGAGKTTLIKILVGLLKGYTGEVIIDNQPIGIHSKSIISYLPDADFLNNNWTVKYIIEYYSDFFKDFDKQKALELIEKLRIPSKASFKELSKGTREKLQLVLTLSRKARIYIFDEPIAGVDPAARDVIFKLILNNVDQNSTIIISTHLISEAEKYLDDVIFIKHGNIIRNEDARALREKEFKTIDEIFREDFKCLEDF